MSNDYWNRRLVHGWGALLLKERMRWTRRVLMTVLRVASAALISTDRSVFSEDNWACNRVISDSFSPSFVSRDSLLAWSFALSDLHRPSCADTEFLSCLSPLAVRAVASNTPSAARASRSKSSTPH